MNASTRLLYTFILPMIDTHAHMDFDPLHTQIVEILTRAKLAGISYIINVGASIQSSRNSIALAETYDNIFATVGVHPDEIIDLEKEENRIDMETMLQMKKVVAVGEIGLDYYRLAPEDITTREKQKIHFIAQSDLAQKYHLPVVIHSRNAPEDTFEILATQKPTKAVMHCYAYNIAYAEKFLALNDHNMISITGIVTFSNAQIAQDVVRAISLERIMIETDAPFLAPQAYRGKTNEPSYVVEVARKIAQLRNIPLSDVEHITDLNALRFYGLPPI